jgi:hypothetical protein
MILIIVAQRDYQLSFRETAPIQLPPIDDGISTAAGHACISTYLGRNCRDAHDRRESARDARVAAANYWIMQG